jgi:hypothetical protein
LGVYLFEESIRILFYGVCFMNFISIFNSTIVCTVPFASVVSIILVYHVTSCHLGLINKLWLWWNCSKNLNSVYDLIVAKI